jgi:hypothetical protein
MSSDKKDKDLSAVQIIGTQVGVTCEPQIHYATNIWSVNQQNSRVYQPD